MGKVPGPRTHPTVKPLATMNRRNLRSWELRLGLVQVVILLGVVTGSIACVFYLGFFSGHRVGFETAMQTTLANSAPIPVDASSDANTQVVADQQLTEIYAKLQEDQPKAGAGAAAREEVPALGNIPTTEEAPVAVVAPDASEGEKAEAKSGSTISVLMPDAKDLETEDLVGDQGEEAPAVDILEMPKPAESKTLGQAAEQQVNTEAKAAAHAKSHETMAEPPKVVAKAEEKKIAPVVAKTAPLAKEEPTKKVSAVTEGTLGAAKAAKSEAVANIAPVDNEPLLIRTVPPPGWYAQISAPRKLQDAEILSKKLKASGFKVVVENAKVRGEEYFRVLVGPETGRPVAERMLEQLKRESYISGDPFIRLVR